MRRRLKWIGLVLLALAALGAIALQQAVLDLEVEELTPSAFALTGLGGNVGVLATSEGVVIVDTMTFLLQGRRIRERAEALAKGPVQLVINSHYHLDHSHGNPGFAAGARIVSTTRTREYMDSIDARFWSRHAAHRPNEFVDGEQEIRVGDKTLRVLHPGRGHTGGDLVVLFVEDEVLHTGDLFFNGSYPNIDLEAGGSVREWAATLERVLALDFERVIPGHGPVTDRAGLERYRDFMAELAQIAEQAAQRGQSLDDFLDAAELTQDAGFGVLGIPGLAGFGRRFVLQRAWEEAAR